MGEPGTSAPLSLEELRGGGQPAHRAQAHALDPGREQVRRAHAHRRAVRAPRLQHRHAHGRADRRRGVSRVTLTVDGALHPIDQVTKQLHKLVNVLKIRDLEPDGHGLARAGALQGRRRRPAARRAPADRGDLPRQDRRRGQALGGDRGHRHDRKDRGVREHGAPVRADRDDAHRRDRDLARAPGDLSAGRLGAAAATAPARLARRGRARSARGRRAAPRRAPRARAGARAPQRRRGARLLHADAAPASSTRARSRAPRAAPGGALVLLRAARPRRRRASRRSARSARLDRARPEALRADRCALARAGRRRWRRSWTAPPAAPVAVGGFAFAPDGGARSGLGGVRSGLAGACPRSRSCGAGAGRLALTLCALVAPDDTREELLERCERRLSELRQRPLPLLDPAPAGALPRGERDAARALRGGGRARARADRARADSRRSCWRARSRCTPPGAHDPAAVLRRPARGVPVLLHRTAVGRGEATLRRREPGAARAPRGPAGLDDGARRLDAAQRRPGGRRAPRRAAPALGARTAKSTRSSHGGSSGTLQPHARLGDGAAGAGAGARREHPASGRRRSARSSPSPREAIELLEPLHPTPAVGGEPARGARR